MSTNQAIEQYANQISELQVKVTELDYVPQAVEQQNKHLAILRKDRKEAEKPIHDLETKTKYEREEYELFKNSIFTRFAFRSTGRKEKYEKLVAKEEQDFIEALEKETQAKQKVELLEKLIADALKELESLNEKKAVLDSLKSEQRKLYEAIFGGPTAEFPADDQLEIEVDQAEAIHSRASAELNAECQALNLLKQAEELIAPLLQHMFRALSHSSRDIGGAGFAADMLEERQWGKASKLSTQAKLLLSQAQQISPNVGAVDFEVPRISTFADGVFDNFASDLAAHQQMQGASAKMSASHKLIKDEIKATKQRVDEKGAALTNAGNNLEKSRSALDQFRWEAVQSVTSGMHQTELKPLAYDGLAPAMPRTWGSRNPFAAMLAGSLSVSDKTAD